MRGIALFLTTGALMGAGQAADNLTKKDLMLIQGRWNSVLVVHSGKEVKLPNVKNVTCFAINGDRITYLDPAGNEPANPIVHRFKLDSTNMPKHMDYFEIDEDKKERTVQGIFEVKGDELRICLDVDGRGRPKAFESKEGSGHRLMVFKRVKS